MKTMKTASEEEARAIELGLEWMRRSVDPGHDIRHALNVEEHALRSYASLAAVGRISDDSIDEALVRICALWHDAFKATQEKPSLYNALVEGVRSSRIVREQLKGLIREDRLKLVLDAVAFHNVPWLYAFRFMCPGRLTTLGLILVEADSLDSFDGRRFWEQWRALPDIVNRSSLILFHAVKYLTMPTFLRSGYACGRFWKEMLGVLPRSRKNCLKSGGPKNQS
jgi:hypothetical protein